jgi:hypothetical protein
MDLQWSDQHQPRNRARQGGGGEGATIIKQSLIEREGDVAAWYGVGVGKNNAKILNTRNCFFRIEDGVRKAARRAPPVVGSSGGGGGYTSYPPGCVRMAARRSPPPADILLVI